MGYSRSRTNGVNKKVWQKVFLQYTPGALKAGNKGLLGRKGGGVERLLAYRRFYMGAIDWSGPLTTVRSYFIVVTVTSSRRQVVTESSGR